MAHPFLHLCHFIRMLITICILSIAISQPVTAGLLKKPPNKIYTANASMAVKSGPGEQFKTIHSISKDYKVKVIAVSKGGTWLKVAHLNNGKTLGYIKVRNTQKTKSTANRLDELLGGNTKQATQYQVKKTSKKLSSANYLDGLLGAVAKPIRHTKGGLDDMLSGLDDEIEMAALDRTIKAEMRQEEFRLQQELADAKDELEEEMHQLRREQEEAEAEEINSKEERSRRKTSRGKSSHQKEMQNDWKNYWAKKQQETDNFGRQLQRNQANIDRAYNDAKSENSRRQRENQAFQNRSSTNSSYATSTSKSKSYYNEQRAKLQRRADKKRNALKKRQRLLMANYENRRAALEKKTNAENKREKELRQRQETLRNKHAYSVPNQKNEIEALTFCSQNKYNKWTCDGPIQKTSGSEKDINVPLGHNHCKNYRKKVPYNNGWVYFCNKMLNLDGKTGKMTWNRNISDWITFPQSILNQRRR